MTVNPISDGDRELMALPSIESQMPVHFKNGACWKNIESQCKGCGRDIVASRFTGRLTRLVESVATVMAIGVCEPCKLVTRFHYRLHDDMRVTGQTEGGWATWRAKPSFLERLRAFISRTFA